MKLLAWMSSTVLFIALSTSIFADAVADCKAAGGTMLTGQVVSPPKFKSGMFRKGVELLHTHLNLRGTDGKISTKLEQNCSHISLSANW